MAAIPQYMLDNPVLLAQLMATPQALNRPAGVDPREIDPMQIAQALSRRPGFEPEVMTDTPPMAPPGPPRSSAFTLQNPLVPYGDTGGYTLRNPFTAYAPEQQSGLTSGMPIPPTAAPGGLLRQVPTPTERGPDLPFAIPPLTSVITDDWLGPSAAAASDVVPTSDAPGRYGSISSPSYTPTTDPAAYPVASADASLADDAAAADRAVRDLQRADGERGGSTLPAYVPRAPMPTTPVDDEEEDLWTAPGRVGNWQEKARGWLGLGDEGTSKLGLALMSAGGAIMSGRGGLGASIGEGIEAGLGTWAARDAELENRKRENFEADLDLWQIQERARVADAQIGLERERFEHTKREAALSRLDPLKALRDEVAEKTLRAQLEALENAGGFDTFLGGLTPTQAGRARIEAQVEAGMLTREQADKILGGDSGLSALGL